MNAIKFQIFSIFFVALTAATTLQAESFWEALGPHAVAIGPDVYHLSRKREGGTHQDGWLGGFRAGYLRLRPNGIYAAADLRYAIGTQDGKTSSGADLKSRLQEFEIEGDLGWTFGVCPGGRLFTLTPYLGYGYFWSSNQFRNPSPSTATFRDTYGFTAVGVATTINLCDCWSIGANFKARWMSDAKQTVIDGPAGHDVVLRIDPRWLYSLDIPITYQFEARGCCLFASLIPYWQQRDYGGTEGVDGDFIDTHYDIWGARLMFGINF